jgi:hypothetical protein
MAEEFWKAETGWVLLRGTDDSLLPYNVETLSAMIVDDDGAPQMTVPAMLRDGVPIIDRDDAHFANLS